MIGCLENLVKLAHMQLVYHGKITSLSNFRNTVWPSDLIFMQTKSIKSDRLSKEWPDIILMLKIQH